MLVVTGSVISEGLLLFTTSPPHTSVTMKDILLVRT